jgi:O-antigen/teichoic acid export membrane protein
MTHLLKRFTLKISEHKPEIKKYFLFILLFGILKLSTFLAPLLLSNLVVDRVDYGLIEYSLSLGMVLVTFLNLGLSGAYPYFNIKLKKEGFKSIFYAHSFFIILFVILGAVLELLNILQLKYFLSLLIGGIVALQMLYSSILKSNEVIKVAIVVDAGLYLVLNVFNILLWCGFSFSIPLLITLLLSYIVILMAIYIRKFLKNPKFISENYVTAIKFGLPLILSGFLIIGLTGIARIIIEYFLGLEEVAIYSFYFRIAGVVVMIHQIINIAFFKKIYEAEPKILDKYFSAFIIAITLISSFLWWVVPIFTINYFELLQETYSSNKLLYFILSIQMTYWIGLALNENIVYRENLASKLNKGLSVVILLMIAALFLIDYYTALTLTGIVIINIIAIFIAIEFQFFYLKKERDIHFPKTRTVNTIILLLLLFIIIFNQI